MIKMNISSKFNNKTCKISNLNNKLRSTIMDQF